MPLVVVLLCGLVTFACAPFPNRVSASLRGPQPRNAFVAPGTDATGMIVWNQPVLPRPVLPPPTGQLTSENSIDTCGGVLGALFAEWKNAHGGQIQPVHGMAAASEFSGSDFWGTHRYRDWNMILVLDDGYDVFLAPGNYYALGGWDDDALVQDLTTSNHNLDGLLELEWDSGFFAPEMAPVAGDETLVAGRWAFDCGHESQSSASTPLGFRAEIHAPEIVLSSHILQSNPTVVRAQFKAFAGSRSGPMNTIPLIFFIQRFFASYKNPLGGQNYSATMRAPGDGWKIASCKIQAGHPAGGRTHKIMPQVQSEDGGRSLTFTLPAQGLNVSARIESSTIIDVSWVRADSSPGGGVTKCE
jgi:hypothetical protein